MNYAYLDIDEPVAGVVRCTMSNPPRHTLVADEVAELDAFVTALHDRNDVRVVIFTGGGEGVFIRHYEVGELAESAERRQAAESGQPGSPRAIGSQESRQGNAAAPSEPPRLHRFNQLTLTMQGAPFVTVAAINGNAAGGGLEFALGCDFRLAADGDYRLGLPETGVGIIPGAGGTQRFVRLLGVAKALDLILHGTLLRPAEALELGLVHAVHPPADLADAAALFARTLAGRPPVALAAAKAAIYGGADQDLATGLVIEQAQFARCMGTKEAAVALRRTVDGVPLTS